MQQFIVDAFESGPFTGNPAAVIPLQDWVSDELMQSVAAENNLSETAFFAPEGDAYRLRWFTPAVEIDLCGHATLATAHVMFDELGVDTESVSFETLSGVLSVAKNGDGLALDFPAIVPRAIAAPTGLLSALGVDGDVLEAPGGYVVVVDSQQRVSGCTPDMAALSRVDCSGVTVTAAGAEYDFVYRMFAPQVGIDEDPATGSAQCALVPYWAEILGRDELTSLQTSARTGRFNSAWRRDDMRVDIAGSCRTFSRGEILI